MSLETVVLDHLPAQYAVHLAFFRNVRNAAFLHSQLLARNTDFEYGLVDSTVVCCNYLPGTHGPLSVVLDDAG